MRTCVECGEVINPKRAELGYRTCIDCAEAMGASAPARCLVPLNKSAYTLITNPEELKMLNPKRVGE